MLINCLQVFFFSKRNKKPALLQQVFRNQVFIERSTGQPFPEKAGRQAPFHALFGCGLVIASLKSKLLACYCSRLSLSLDKIGCGSADSNQKNKFFFCLCTHLSLSLSLDGTSESVSFTGNERRHRQLGCCHAFAGCRL